ASVPSPRGSKRSSRPVSGKKPRNGRAQLGNALSGPGRGEDHFRMSGGVLLRGGAGGGEAAIALGWPDIILLGQDDLKGDRPAVEELHHPCVAGLDAVPPIDQEEGAQQRGAAA